MPDGARSPSRSHLGFLLVWLLYLAYPVSLLIQRHLPPVASLAVILLIAAFTASSLVVWQPVVRGPFRGRIVYGVGIVGWAATLALLLREPQMLQLAVYAGAVFGAEPDRRRWVALTVGLLTAVAMSLALLHGTRTDYLAVLVTVVAVTVGMRGFGLMMIASQRVRVAEAEIEALAAANERLRIGRDLHDVVGHHLSAMALRAELAATEARESAPEASREMDRIAELARTALADVRTVVAGYQGVSLPDEWRRLHTLLDRAGIRSVVAFDASIPNLEAERALALILRETVTNILRHSEAKRCHVRLWREQDTWLLEVADDGRGTFEPSPGSGLTGIRDRAQALGGSAQWQHTADGFRVRVQIPTEPVDRGLA